VNFQQYPALLAAARQGDPRSQAIVGRTMVYCAHTRGIPFSTPNTKNRASIVKERPNHQKEGARETEVREFCAQRPTEEIASGIEWLKAAAANGDVEARTRLPSLYRVGSDEQVSALDTAWRQGSVTALHKLANAYWRRSFESGPESADAINALASTWLYAKLNESAFREQGGSDFVDALRKDLARRFDTASPGVQSQAISTARRMLSEADGCCSFP
jgi:hypothetical protein